MTIFTRIESQAVQDSTNFNVRATISFINGASIVNSVANLLVGLPTPGTAMRFNDSFRQAVSAYVNSAYGLSTVQSDVVTFSSRGNLIRVPVDFGSFVGTEETTASATISATWVTSNSVITCQPQSDSFGDHDPEDVIIEGVIARAINIVPGVSFDVMCYASEGTWGRYTVNCAGN